MRSLTVIILPQDTVTWSIINEIKSSVYPYGEEMHHLLLYVKQNQILNKLSTVRKIFLPLYSKWMKYYCTEYSK